MNYGVAVSTSGMKLRESDCDGMVARVFGVRSGVPRNFFRGGGFNKFS